MSWELGRILIDFGILILIWLVQVIIYPGFQFADAKQFTGWHHSYSSRITYFVLPLMFLQVGLYARSLITGFHWLDVAGSACIALAWLMTFIWIVPVHSRIGRQLETAQVKKLVQLNWVRTWAWTAVFVMGLLKMGM